MPWNEKELAGRELANSLMVQLQALNLNLVRLQERIDALLELEARRVQAEAAPKVDVAEVLKTLMRGR